VAFVIAKRDVNLEKVLSHANNRLSESQKINKILLWREQDFPRTTTLKIKRAEVLDKLNSKTKIRAFEDQLYNLIQNILGTSQISEYSVLEKLGMDSINRIRLVSSLEEHYNTEIDESLIGNNTTVKDLRSLITSSATFDNRILLSNFNNSRLAFLTRFLLQPLVYLFSGTARVSHNLEQLPDGPFIIVANHSSHLDTFAILRSLPLEKRIKTAPAAAEDYFFNYSSPLGYFKSNFLRLWLNLFPFARKGGVNKSLKYAGKLLDANNNIIIFPEGTRSLTKEMNAFLPGIGLAAQSLNAQIIPVYIEGAYDLLPKGRRIPSWGRIEVFFGKPITKFSGSFSNVAKNLENEVRNLIQK
jgi:long-chain acyl-CoA synthetase